MARKKLPDIADFKAEGLITEITKYIVGEMKEAVPWRQLGDAEKQQRVIRAQDVATNLVGQAIVLALAGGEKHVRAKIGNLKVTPTDIVFPLTCDKEHDTATALSDAVGHVAVLRLIDIERFGSVKQPDLEDAMGKGHDGDGVVTEDGDDGVAGE